MKQKKLEIIIEIQPEDQEHSDMVLTFMSSMLSGIKQYFQAKDGEDIMDFRMSRFGDLGEDGTVTDPSSTIYRE